jgi:hypothetical protein
MSAKSAAPVIGTVAAMLALAGTLAVVQLSQSPQHESQRQVELVQPAAQTVTVTPSPTTTTVAVAPKKVAPKPAAVESTTSAPAPTVQQKVATVPQSEPAPQTSTSEPSKPAPFGTASNGLPKPPPVDFGTQDKPPTSTN